jgi:hypothetical protein
VRNGTATPREVGFAKQTQVMLVRGWFAEDVAQSNFKIDVKLEPWLRRYSGKRVPQIYISISHSLPSRTVMQSTFFERAYDSFQDYIRNFDIFILTPYHVSGRRPDLQVSGSHDFIYVNSFREFQILTEI